MKSIQFTKLFALLFTVAFAFSSCEEDEAMRGPKKSSTPAIDNIAESKGAPAPSNSTLLDIASNADIDGDGELDFTILAAALAAADETVLATLSDSDQYTVFAPTDEAFVKLLGKLDVTAEQLLANTDLLTTVLLYHVAEGRRATNSVVPKNKARTIETLLEGVTFEVNNTPGIDAVGSTANFVATDISASNGIIHVIDEVLLPIEL